MGAEQPPYVAQRVREALVEDPRVGQMDLEVTVEGERILLTGSVPTEERRAAIDEVVASVAPGWEVHNATTVEQIRDADAPENLP